MYEQKPSMPPISPSLNEIVSRLEGCLNVYADTNIEISKRLSIIQRQKSNPVQEGMPGKNSDEDGIISHLNDMIDRFVRLNQENCKNSLHLSEIV